MGSILKMEVDFIMKAKIFSILIIGTIFLASFGVVATYYSTENESENNCGCNEAETNVYRTGLLSGGPALPESIKFSGVTPPTWDWRDATYSGIAGDWTTNIKNQGNCGSCYAFGSLAALESLIKIKSKNPDLSADLSEQFMVSCGQEWMSGMFGCDGAYFSPTFNFIKIHGAIPESCFPYVSGGSGYVPPCSDKCPEWQDLVVEIEDWHSVSSDIESIKNALIQYGPLPTAMVVYEDFHSYPGGVYEHPGPDPDPTNHIVTIVGYNDYQNCWICKNSWGTYWGENGWFRIAYGDCKIEQETVYLDYDAPSDVVVDVLIHRIKLLDEIEGWLEGEADWSYRVSIYNGDEWIDAYNDEYSSNEDDHTEDVCHRFNAYASEIIVKIKVWDRDFWSGDDLADVSGYIGGGVDNSIPDSRGAIYQGDYDLIQDIVTSGDTVIEEGGYYTTSGEYSPDSSTTVDENDAKVWFKISDNYEPPEPDLDVSGSLDGEVKRGTKHYHLGSFIVENIGIDPSGFGESYLDWEIAKTPDWGSNWEFEPDGGNDLPSGESTTVEVYVDVPSELGTFTGEIKVWNSENHADYGTVPIQLKVSFNQELLQSQTFEFPMKKFFRFSITQFSSFISQDYLFDTFK